MRPHVEPTYVYECPSSVLPLHEPPSAMNANGRRWPFASSRQRASPYLARLVLPVPGGPSKPKQYPFCSPVIHWAMTCLIERLALVCP